MPGRKVFYGINEPALARCKKLCFRLGINYAMMVIGGNGP